MTAIGYGLDDKVSKDGDTMTGTLVFQGTPPFTVVASLVAGKATLNGTNAVVVDTTAVDSNSLILLTVQPAVAPVGIPYVSTIVAGTSFSLKSTSASDSSVVVAWYVIEHS